MYKIEVRFLNDKRELSKRSYVYNLPDNLYPDLETEDMLSWNGDVDMWQVPTYKIKTYFDGKTNEYYNSLIIITDIWEDEKETAGRPYVTLLTEVDAHYFEDDKEFIPTELHYYADTIDGEFGGAPIWYSEAIQLHEERKMTQNDLMTAVKAYAEAPIQELTTDYANSTDCSATNKAIVDYANSTGYSTTNKAITWNGCDQNNDTLKEYLDYCTINTNTTSISGTVSIGGISDLEKEINILKDTVNDLRKEKENMDTKKIFGNIQFGKETAVKMSMYGPAFKAYGGEEWTAYDKKNEEWIDVTAMLFNFDFPMFYKMPVAQDAVKTGDYIYHMNSYVRVIDFDDALRPVVEDPFSKTVKTILPTKNMFGFDFYTKLVSLAGDLTSMATKDQPFGNILPFMLMGDSKNAKDMLPMMMLMNGGQMDMSNPFMMMALCGDGKMSDMLPLMMLMNKKETK